MTRVAVLQSNYLPWKGYFDIIHRVDICVIYDDVQYTKNDWRNRNRIVTANGLQWLTVPVGDSISRLIKGVTIPRHQWQEKHWKSIVQAYSKSPYFHLYREELREVYLDSIWHSLSELNLSLMRFVCRSLGIKTEFRDSGEFDLSGEKSERLLNLLSQIGAHEYISGPAAKGYLDSSAFHSADIAVEYMQYKYPSYPQRFEPFTHEVSAIDLLFAVGRDAGEFIW